MIPLKNALLFLLIALFACIASAQTKEEIAIDSLLDLSTQQYDNHNNTKAFDYAQKALSLAKQNNIKSKIADSYFSLASISYISGFHNEALYYTNKGEKICPADEKLILSKIQLLEAVLFMHTGLEKQALDQSYKIVATLMPYSKRKTENIYLRNTCELIASIYANKGQQDSVKKYNHIVKTLFFALPEKEMYNTIAQFYSKEAFIVYDRTQNIDSALTLFNKSFALKKKYNDSNLYSEYHYLGDFYSDKNIDKALESYLKSLASAKAKNIDPRNFFEIYLSISELYGKKGDLVNEKKYLSLYTEKNQEVITQQKKSTEYIFNAIVEENKIVQEKQRMHQNILLLIIGSSIVMTALAIFFIIKRKYRRQQKQLTKQLNEKHETVEELNKKINESFEELVKLAKNNDPQFWVRFQEVYPDFLKKMTLLNDKLTVTELTTTAYHYLGFTTKDIANHTFKALRTVEGVRYRLRKKLGIAPDENFILWIRKYIDNV